MSRAVPSVAAVHQNGFAPVVDRLDDVAGDGHQLAEIVEPLGALQVGEEAGGGGRGGVVSVCEWEGEKGRVLSVCE